MASRRIEFIRDFPLLELNQSVLDLAEQFLERSNLPAKLERLFRGKYDKAIETLKSSLKVAQENNFSSFSRIRNPFFSKIYPTDRAVLGNNTAVYSF